MRVYSDIWFWYVNKILPTNHIIEIHQNIKFMLIVSNILKKKQEDIYSFYLTVLQQITNHKFKSRKNSYRIKTTYSQIKHLMKKMGCGNNNLHWTTMSQLPKNSISPVWIIIAKTLQQLSQISSSHLLTFRQKHKSLLHLHTTISSQIIISIPKTLH